MLNKIALISVCNTNLCIEISAQLSCMFVELSYNKMIRVSNSSSSTCPKTSPFQLHELSAPAGHFLSTYCCPIRGFLWCLATVLHLREHQHFRYSCQSYHFFFPWPEYRLRRKKKGKRNLFTCTIAPYKLAERGQIWPSVTGRVLKYPVFKTLNSLWPEYEQSNLRESEEKRNICPQANPKRGEKRGVLDLRANAWNIEQNATIAATVENETNPHFQFVTRQ